MGRPRSFDWNEAERLYAETHNYHEVARRLGVTHQSVRHALIPAARAYGARHQRDNRPHQGTCPDCGGVSSHGRYLPASRCKACDLKRRRLSKTTP